MFSRKMKNVEPAGENNKTYSQNMTLFRKINIEKYLSGWLILLVDIVLSTTSSLLVMFMYGLLVMHRTPTLLLSAIWGVGAFVFSAIMFVLLRTYKSIIRYSTLREIGLLGLAILGKTVLLWILLTVLHARRMMPESYWILLLDYVVTFGVLVLLRIFLITTYDMIRKRYSSTKNTQRILIYGDGEKAVSQVLRLRNSVHYKVVGFLIYGKRQEMHTLSGYRVYYFEDEQNLRVLRERYDIDGVLFPYYADAQREQERLLRYCPKCGIQTLITPSIDTIREGQIPKPIRKIKIEDLLGREEIEISMEEVKTSFKGKTVLVTGAAGSIGSELCRQLAKIGILELVMYDNAETPLHNLRLEFERKYPELKFTPVIGDVRIPARLDYVFRKFHPQIVFHAAAYKHVPLMEENPCEAVLVNVAGTRNVADKCIEYCVEKMVMISTDKAVNPTNVMGCTKRLAEIYVQSLGLAVASGKVLGKTKFITTRFGNVLGSNGSVIPRFKEQIAAGGPLTVTHPEITRYFMTIPEACRLVMEAATISSGNEICVFDMGESIKIVHLAEQMIELSGFRVGKDIKIEFTGLRPGEKLYEEVLSDNENTVPTSHDRIRVAKVREYDYANAQLVVNELETLSRKVNIPETIQLMKNTVPEYHSEKCCNH